MTVEEITRWRNRIGKSAAFLCVLMMLALLDGLISGFKHDPQKLEMIPGETTDVNGNLRSEAAGVQELKYTSDSRGLALAFEAVHTGFWLGGPMWRGKVKAAPGLAAGDYGLSVFRTNDLEGKPAAVFRVKVYPDERSRQLSSSSLLISRTGGSPWWISAGMLPFVLLGFAAVFLLSTRREALLALEGKTEIFHIVRCAGGFEFSFGFGRIDGIAPGDSLPLLDEEGRQVGSVTVKEVMERDSMASAGTDCEPKPGYMVFLPGRGPVPSGGDGHGA